MQSIYIVPQAAQAQDVNLINVSYSIPILLRNVRFIEIVWEVNLFSELCLDKPSNVQIKVTYFKV